MKGKYREVRTECGSYLDVDIFPVMQVYRAGLKRGKKFKPTPETMARYNQRRRETRIERLVLTNFEGTGIFYNPSYSPEHYPGTEDQCRQDVRNFLRRLKRYRARHSLPELKYIYKIERGKRSGRLHVHTILNCADMPLGILDEIWGKGYCYSSALSCDADGCAGLARYFCKGKAKKQKAEPEEEDLGEDISRSWVPSKNLTKPAEHKRDGKISKRKAAEFCRLGEDAKPEFEKLYPGYSFSFCRTLYNDINGGCYITVRMRKLAPGKRGRNDRRRY
ncbi:MAG: hypothetical protein IKH78_08285 [Ruminococcus sp.]|nr:hypothetical protein [Ruminococcus sp.]